MFNVEWCNLKTNRQIKYDLKAFHNYYFILILLYLGEYIEKNNGLNCLHVGTCFLSSLLYFIVKCFTFKCSVIRYVLFRFFVYIFLTIDWKEIVRTFKSMCNCEVFNCTQTTGFFVYIMKAKIPIQRQKFKISSHQRYSVRTTSQ